MGLFDRFPWVNTHDLNLDWIIQKMKEWGAAAAENVAKAETAATNAATAATNAATAAEPYAVRAETAADRAETAKSSAETAQTGANSSAKKALASAGKAENSASNAERYAQDCNSANASAQLAASAAAQSAEEAKTATKWPYDGVYNGYLYKRLDAVDPYTTTKMEFLTAPQDNGVLYRVSGRIPKRGSFNDATSYDYHYEKIIKMTGDLVANRISFSDSFIPSIVGLAIAEAEPVGLILFNKSNQTFYKYSSLPLANTNSSGQFGIYSTGFEIPDDAACTIEFSVENELLNPSQVTAYLYVRMKYTF